MRLQPGRSRSAAVRFVPLQLGRGSPEVRSPGKPPQHCVGLRRVQDANSAFAFNQNDPESQASECEIPTMFLKKQYFEETVGSRLNKDQQMHLGCDKETAEV